MKFSALVFEYAAQHDKAKPSICCIPPDAYRDIIIQHKYPSAKCYCNWYVINCLLAYFSAIVIVYFIHFKIFSSTHKYILIHKKRCRIDLRRCTVFFYLFKSVKYTTSGVTKWSTCLYRTSVHLIKMRTFIKNMAKSADFPNFTKF